MLLPLPLLVVIKITPALPRYPYNADAAAPFSTDIVSMSSGFKLPIASPISAWLSYCDPGALLGLFSIGTPLITYNGWLVCVKLDTPRIITFDDEPGPPAVGLTFKPATLPSRSFITLGSLAWVSSSPFTSVIE